MLASLAFYNYWYLPIRMYTMFVAAELLLLWIYFRIIWRQRTSLGAYIALGLSCLFFLSTQVFSLAICCGLAVYHLIYPRKTRHWLYVALAGTIALLVLLPWFGTLMTGAVEIVEGEFGEIDVLNPLQLTETVFSMGSERQYRVCRAVGAITATSPCSRSLRDSALGYPGGGDRIHHRGQSIDRRDRLASGALSRDPLPACHPLGGQRDDEPGAVEARFHRRSAILDRQRLAVPAAGWRGLLRAFAYGTIPIHLVERQLREELRAGDLITGWTDGLNFDYRTPYGGVIDVYFADHDVEFAFRHNYVLGQKDAEEIAAALTVELDGHKRVWLTYELDNASRYRDLFENVLERQYERCSSDASIRNVIIELYQLDGCS